MKAIRYDGSGAPADVIKVVDAPRPELSAGDILVKVHASAVTPTDTVSRQGSNAIVKLIEVLTGGVSIPGDVFAGTVEEVTPEVSKFKIGERVFGTLAPNTGTHAEFVKINQNKVVALIPANISFAKAAALVDGPLTANAFLQKIAHIQPGQSILINGASGSVGTAAVQLAKEFGAQVTGVCSTANVEFVKSLGADHVVDYTQTDFTKLNQSFDIVFDTVSKSSYLKCQPIMKERAIYMTTGPSLHIIKSYFATRLTKQKAVMGATGPFWKQSELEYLCELITHAKLAPIIDSEFDFTEAAKAHEKVDTGHKVGSVILRLEHD